MSSENPTVPYGFCQCGCGEKAPIATASDRNRGLVRGEPRRFVHGHNTRRAVRYVVQDCGYATPCWVWQLFRHSNGYGGEQVDGRSCLAHVVSYERHVGPVPEDLQLDHLCRVRACVNPAHLEPVTLAVNVLRGIGPSAVNARKTHCKRGHEFSPENTHITTDGKRVCRACKREWVAEKRHRTGRR
jgi:hypothetical protein